VKKTTMERRLHVLMPEKSNGDDFMKGPRKKS